MPPTVGPPQRVALEYWWAEQRDGPQDEGCAGFAVRAESRSGGRLCLQWDFVRWVGGFAWEDETLLVSLYYVQATMWKRSRKQWSLGFVFRMAWCLVAGGCCFLLPDSVDARLPLIAFFVYLFTAFYSPGKNHSSLRL